MSDGIFDRILYGKCETKQALKRNLGPGQYRLYLGAQETSLNQKCCGGVQCTYNNNATISNTWDSIGKRTDIESELRVLVRATGCNADQHQMCQPNSQRMACNPGIPATPHICNRAIVPTNMVMPTSRGF